MPATGSVSEGGGTLAERKRSLIFRYAMVYAAVFSATMLAVLGFLYWSTFAVDEGRVDAEINAEAEELRASLERKPVAEITSIIARISSDQPGGSTIYMLATQRREWVAGNLRDWPLAEGAGARPRDGEDGGEREGAGEPSDAPAGDAEGQSLHGGGVFEFPVGEGTAQTARGRSIPLPGGHELLVGRNLGETAKLRELILRSMFGAFGITLIFGVVGGLMLGRRVSSRLGEINHESEAILAGDLDRRMPVGSAGDEFDELASNLNRMLDRIQGLMDGMRSVSDEIAHDLRSPISRLKSRIEVALMREDDSEGHREALEETVREADRILAIFNSLLAITLAESGAARDRFRAVDLTDLADDVAETYEPLAAELGLTLVRGEDAARPALVHGDPHLLAQMLANLLDNATKYVPRDGRVEVRIDPPQGEPDGWRLVVADNGPGVSDEFRQRAFERFSRADESRSAPGSGLGLSLVRAVAHLHGGEVLLEDAAPGLRVTVELPSGMTA